MLVSIVHQIACIRVNCISPCMFLPWDSPDIRVHPTECCTSIRTITPPSSYPMPPSIRLTEYFKLELARFHEVAKTLFDKRNFFIPAILQYPS
jgi:hypothetical protein